MSISLQFIENSKCENVICFYDKFSSLKVFTSIHNTTLGPAIGGCRMVSYGSESEALEDAIRLAKSMTKKCALAGVDYGGGKSVILCPENGYDREKLFKAFGQFVNSLRGRYITAIDSGTTMEDMAIVAQKTSFVTGYANQFECQFNPSYYTAMGVFEALKACIEFKYGSYSLKEKSVLVKGIGGVGKYIVDFLNQQGARLYITDIDYKKIEQCKKEIEAIAVSPEDLLKHKYDIICPCDINYTVTPENIDEIDTDIIVGATNNQLSHPDLAGMLAEKNILYCPDYVANSGGLIYVTDLYEKKPLATLKAKIENIYSTALNVFQLANKTSITTKEAADRLAQNVIDSVNRSREINYAAYGFDV